MAKFEIYEDAQASFHWRFRANNGEVLAESVEVYHNRANCEHSILLLKQQSASAAVADVAPASLSRSASSAGQNTTREPH
jgi:uncharacterized protein